MKKATMQTIANYIKSVPELANEYAEVAAELAKNDAKAQANRDMYNAAEKVVMAHLTSTPKTVADLYTECAAELPKDFSPSKLSYGLTRKWTGGFVVIKGKVNEYKKA